MGDVDGEGHPQILEGAPRMGALVEALRGRVVSAEGDLYLGEDGVACWEHLMQMREDGGWVQMAQQRASW